MNTIDAIKQAAEPFEAVETACFDGFLQRIGDARIVMMGESTHGTSEFFRMRAALTQALIEKRGFNLVVVEWDWPDMETVDRYIRHLPVEKPVFARFPSWMYKNREFLTFVEQLKTYNASSPLVRIFGMDLYCLGQAIERVLESLEKNAPEITAAALESYRGLYAWKNNPMGYAEAAAHGITQTYESQVQNVYERVCQAAHLFQGEEFFLLEQNMRTIIDAEKCYRAPDPISHWNIRANRMGDAIESLLGFYGSEAKAVVWAHNSHIGDVSATHFQNHGYANIGQRFKEAYRVGFGFFEGKTATSSTWGGPLHIREIAPPHPGSYESLFHQTGLPSFLLPLKEGAARESLMASRYHRAIGSVYTPGQELTSNYFQTTLPLQFDEYAWFVKMDSIEPC